MYTRINEFMMSYQSHANVIKKNDDTTTADTTSILKKRGQFYDNLLNVHQINSLVP